MADKKGEAQAGTILSPMLLAVFLTGVLTILVQHTAVSVVEQDLFQFRAHLEERKVEDGALLCLTSSVNHHTDGEPLEMDAVLYTSNAWMFLSRKDSRITTTDTISLKEAPAFARRRTWRKPWSQGE